MVASVTLKARPDTTIAGGSLNFTDSTANYWTAVEMYHEYLPTIVDTGVFTVESVADGSFVDFLHGPNKTVSEVDLLLRPYLDNLTSLGITYSYNMTLFPNYEAEYTGTRDVFHFSVGLGQAGGYLIPRSFVQANNSALTSIVRQIAEGGLQFKGFAVNVANKSGAIDNAVLPAWRETLVHSQITLSVKIW